LTALEKIIQHLKLFKKTPDNGLVVFCGNVSQVEGKEDIRLWSYEPPVKMLQKIYWCDQEFVVKPLRELVEEKEIYGLIVLDAREADIGLLKGKAIEKLKHLESTVPSKSVKGGMCIHRSSLVQLENGEIIPVEELKNGRKILSCSFKRMRPIFTDSFKIMKRKANIAFEIITKEPHFRIIATPEHKVFVVTENGIEKKYVEDLKIGDRLLAIKKIEMNNSNSTLDKEFCQVLGYMLGDGTLDGNRIILYEKDFQLAKFYSKLITKVFKKKPKILRYGNTYEIRLYSIDIVKFLNKNYEELLVRSVDRKIPLSVMQSSNISLAKFIRGLFDAEGYITQEKIAIRLTNERIIATLQCLLLRFDIVSSISGPDKLGRYTLQITNPQYVKKFYQKIGFSSKEKNGKLKAILRKSTRSLVNRVPILGSLARKKLKEINLNKQNFNEISTFLMNKRNISYDIFYNRLLKKIKLRLRELTTNNTRDIRKLRMLLRLKQSDVARAIGCSTTTVCDLERNKYKNPTLENAILKYLLKEKKNIIKKTKKTLDYFIRLFDSDLIQTIIQKKKLITIPDTFYDLYVPRYNSFVVNGLVIHNSQRRYDRIREDAINEFLTKVGEVANQVFLEQPSMKGIIIGGPGGVKETFFKEDYLHYKLKQIVIGVKDTGYTGEFGLEELVERSKDLLKEAAISKERELLEKFFTELSKEGNVVYGYEETNKALDAKAVETLLVSEGFNWVHAKLKCQCGFETEKDLPKNLADKQLCSSCGKTLAVEEVKDLADIITEKATSLGAKIEFISTDTREGIQFKELGGIGAFLKFKLD
jgi:peptide subunit release factor 1 (eRF1)/DNA-binding XRE family transcriptional regulator